jgi:hypothetical protein
MWVGLSDGWIHRRAVRLVSAPVHPEKSKREKAEIGHFGLQWAEIDEDISSGAVGRVARSNDQFTSRDRSRSGVDVIVR